MKKKIVSILAVLVMLFSVTACGSIAAGVAEARRRAGDGGLVVAVGSLYMAGPIRDCFGLE